MSNLGTVIAIMISAFVTGGLARLAVPGPDPMPAWLTVAIGLVGSVAGGAVAAVAFDRDPYAISIGSFAVAVTLVIVYRRFVQRRPIVGPEALRFPHRGIGVSEYRARLAKAGVDPDALLDRALSGQRGPDESSQPPPEGDSERGDEEKDEGPSHSGS